jgi:hypothetical protein
MNRTFVTASVFGLLFCGCIEGNMNYGGSDGDPANEVICYGDPDETMVCGTREDFFDCTAMPNGDLKCTNKDFTTPDGASGWICSVSEDNIVCVKEGSDITGSGGWDCTSDGTTTTCTTTQPGTPVGGSDWSCSYVEGVGLVCTGTPAGDGSGGDTNGGSGGILGAGGAVGSTGGESSGGSSGDTNGGSGGILGAGGAVGSTGGESSGDTGGGSGAAFPCSYAMVVFTYGGEIYVMKVPQGWTTCTFTNNTSSDRNFTYDCNGDTYSNPDFIFSKNGSPVPTYTGSLPCSDLFTVSGREVWAKAGVTILYAVAHNGSFPNHFATLCPSASGVTYMSFPIECGGAN